MVIEEKWFSDMNLTDGATFPASMIKCEKTRVNQKINFPCDTKRRIREISLNNGWNTQIVQILCELCDGDFLFGVKVFSILTKPVELTHKYIKKVFKYQQPYFYSLLFDESENGPFEVPPRRIKTYDNKKSVPDATKLYVLQENNRACVLFSLSSEFYFIDDKISADCFKDEIKPSLKANCRLKFHQDLALNNLIEKVKS